MCLIHGAADPGGSARTFPEPGVGRSYAPSRSVRIVHLDLTLQLWPDERRFEGRALIRWEALPIFDGVVALDLEEIEVRAVTDGAGCPRTYRVGAGLRIQVDGRAGDLEITWSGRDPTRGLHFVGPTSEMPDRAPTAWTQNQDENARYVLPCHDHPGVRHPWTVRLEGPAGWTLLSNGARTGEGERDGRGWATFRQSEPMPAYLLTAVCAPLAVVEAPGPVPVRFLVPPGGEEAARRNMGRTGRMMDVLAERTGVPYPWPRYDQVVVHEFIFGGMENTACTTMTELLLADPRATVEWSAEALVVHELAHQWFGDLVTCRDWSQAWLNEGWATFCETVWVEETDGPRAATWYRWGQLRNYLDEDARRYRRPIESYAFRAPIDVFDRHLYEKGALVLASLRTLLGAPAFWAGVQRYLAVNEHRSVHTRDFQRAMEEATGADLDRFFDQFVRGAGHPELTVVLADEGSGSVAVTVRQTQTGIDTAESFHLPLAVEVVRVDGTVEARTLPVTDRTRTWVLPTGADVHTVRVDPGFQVLAEVTVEGPAAWLVAALEDACPTVVVRAARALAAGGGRGLAAVRASAVGHPFHGARAELAGILAERGGDEQRASLIRLLSDPDPRVQKAAAEGLGQFRDPVSADALIAALDPDAPWHRLSATLAALGKTRDPRALPTLLPWLEVDSWAELVRRGALEGLAATGEPSALPPLLAASRRPADRVRAGAALALGALAERRPEVRADAVARLTEMLVEPGFYAVLAACQALGVARDPAASPALRRLHTSGADGRQRRSAWEALRKVEAGPAGAEGIGRLERRLDDLATEAERLRSRLDRLAP